MITLNVTEKNEMQFDLSLINQHNPHEQVDANAELAVGFKKLCLNKFSMYFKKCTGALNSTVKTAPSGVEQITIVCKDRIGIQYGDKNNKYADGNELHMLQPQHANLICNKGKRQAVQDFIDLKEGLKQRLEFAESSILKGIAETGLVYCDVSIISKKRADQYSSEEHIGYFLGNSVTVQRSELTVKPLSSGSDLDSWRYCIPSGFELKELSNLGEIKAMNIGVYQKEKLLFTLQFYVASYDYKLKKLVANVTTSNKSHLLNDVSLKVMASEYIKNFNEVVEWFDKSLEELKEKHEFAWMMNSLDDANCLI